MGRMRGECSLQGTSDHWVRRALAIPAPGLWRPCAEFGSGDSALFEEILMTCRGTFFLPLIQSFVSLHGMSMFRVIVEAVQAGGSQSEVGRLYDISGLRVSEAGSRLAYQGLGNPCAALPPPPHQ